MYDNLIDSLHNLLLSRRSALLSDRVERNTILVTFLHSLKEHIDMIFFLTDFQKKDFVREWCEQHPEEDNLVERFRNVAEQLDAFAIDEPYQTKVVTFDELRENLSLVIPILGAIINDIRR